MNIKEAIDTRGYTSEGLGARQKEVRLDASPHTEGRSLGIVELEEIFKRSQEEADRVWGR